MATPFGTQTEAPVMRKVWRRRLGRAYHQWRRYGQRCLRDPRCAKDQIETSFGYRWYEHQSVLLRSLKGMDMYLQGYSRHIILNRNSLSLSDGTVLEDESIVENHALMMYNLLLPSQTSRYFTS